jgi:hypothetical protein
VSRNNHRNIFYLNVLVEALLNCFAGSCFCPAQQSFVGLIGLALKGYVNRLCGILSNLWRGKLRFTFG